MKKSCIFHTDKFREVQQKTKDFLNRYPDFLSAEGTHATISDVLFAPIEFLDWDCLTVGALGWGQIQIANSNRICLRPRYSRQKWMLELCDIMSEFYPREITKIQARIKYFERLKGYWEQKEE